MEIRGGRNSTGAGLSPSYFVFPHIFTPINTISLRPEVGDSPDQAAHYHMLSI
jgi:hypothetical protein